MVRLDRTMMFESQSTFLMRATRVVAEVCDRAHCPPPHSSSATAPSWRWRPGTGRGAAYSV
jgi:hypothetical protein